MGLAGCCEAVIRVISIFVCVCVLRLEGVCGPTEHLSKDKPLSQAAVELIKLSCD